MALLPFAGKSGGSSGSNSWVVNEVPTGTVNGTTTAFTTGSAYVGGTLQVYRDGQLMEGSGNDYTETTPSSGTFTFTTAPVTGSILLCTYQKSTSTTGNAQTVNGYSANATPTANQVPVLDSNAYIPQAAVNPVFRGDFANYVHSGLTIPTSATLSATSVAGSIFYGGKYISVASDGGHTYTASQDTYVDVDNTGAYHYSGVANGATAPALTTNSIRIAKVVTSASAVTSVTQQGRDNKFTLIYPNSPEKNIYMTNYKFRAHLSANQSIPNAAFTKVTLDTIDYDPSSNFDAVTNHRFTVPYSGFYFVHVKTIFVAPATGTRMLIDIYKNGASVEEMQSVTNTTNDQGLATFSILQLNAGDYLEMYLYQNNTVAESVYGGINTTYMEGHLLSI